MSGMCVYHFGNIDDSTGSAAGLQIYPTPKLSEAIELGPLSLATCMSPVRSPSPPYDYTEGTSALDIDEVARSSRRTRRESQVGLSYTAGSTADFCS